MNKTITQSKEKAQNTKLMRNQGSEQKVQKITNAIDRQLNNELIH